LSKRKSSRESPWEIRAILASRLRTRLPEIEKAIFSRVRSLTDRSENDDHSYLAGLREAVSAALVYGIEGVEKGLDRPTGPPPATITQARRAAREGISLDIVLRRYAAGGKMLEDFVLAESADVSRAALREILADLGPETDALMARIAAEYKDEIDRADRSFAQREAVRIAGLVHSDSPVAPLDFDFDFDLWHVGVIFRGGSAERTARQLAYRFGYRLLCAVRDEETVWAWLSSPSESAARNVDRLLGEHMPGELAVALGEPRLGMDGWRLTHREARVALRVMLRRPQRLTRVRDVILLAGILDNETLMGALLDAYLGPLENDGNLNQDLLDTLRAYFSAGGNAAASAALLGVTRHTVQRRIKTIEQSLGQPIHACYSELVVALQVADLIGMN